MRADGLLGRPAVSGSLEAGTGGCLTSTWYRYLCQREVGRTSVPLQLVVGITSRILTFCDCSRASWNGANLLSYSLVRQAT
jgi:hypothetical protein